MENLYARAFMLDTGRTKTKFEREDKLSQRASSVRHEPSRRIIAHNASSADTVGWVLNDVSLFTVKGAFHGRYPSTLRRIRRYRNREVSSHKAFISRTRE